MIDTVVLKKTPLHDWHVAVGAKMMPFAGFDMPVQYSGIIDEHLSVRNAAGLFDVCHMGEFMVSGPAAAELIQHVVTNDVGKMYDGRAMYTVMCRPDGGIVDDLLVYRITEYEYMLVVNASNMDKDFNWIQSQNSFGATLRDVSELTALIALQGPNALDILQPLVDEPLEALKYYHFVVPKPGTFLGCNHAIISYTGYTGEQGFEIYCESSKAVEVWETLMEKGSTRGLKPTGLGARDTLRLEAGYCLYGNDITDETNPLEAGLGWVVKLDKGSFLGRDVLVPIKETGPARKLIGFVTEGKVLPRHGYAILDSTNRVIGSVTSGGLSPILERGIGLGYVENVPEFTESGKQIYVEVRGRGIPALVSRPPFHKK